eukprot:1907596-Ditylum_brightwellii.AAC.1
MICQFTTFVFAALMALAAASPFAPAQSKNNSKAEYVPKLLRKATPTINLQLCHLDKEYEMDLTPYSLKFMQCKSVKAYDDKMANDELGTILVMECFVTFHLCPDCDLCLYGYREYMINLESYLETTTDYYQEEKENYCKACNECSYFDNDAYVRSDDNFNFVYNCYRTCIFHKNCEDCGVFDAV